MKKFNLLLTLVFIASGCADKAPSSQVNSPASQPETPGTPTTPPTPNSNTREDHSQDMPQGPATVLAKGWVELVINANSAKTTVSNVAHFSTTRNACGKDAYGVITLENWNSLAKNLNEAVKPGANATASIAESTTCFPTPDAWPYMNDKVEIKLEQSNRILYEVKDDQICSTIQDPQIAKDLLADIQKMILTADKEDCPNGWGSNLMDDRDRR